MSSASSLFSSGAVIAHAAVDAVELFLFCFRARQASHSFASPLSYSVVMFLITREAEADEDEDDELLPVSFVFINDVAGVADEEAVDDDLALVAVVAASSSSAYCSHPNCSYSLLTNAKNVFEKICLSLTMPSCLTNTLSSALLIPSEDDFISECSVKVESANTSSFKGERIFSGDVWGGGGCIAKRGKEPISCDTVGGRWLPLVSSFSFAGGIWLSSWRSRLQSSTGYFRS
ncbi:uncharacterized protein MONOS_943 [Monocercomonoides exilis]|uniref:uncharacterized protein n=1 Tax=Monocercomonoides exilis TaxID=2049356 RepID=UPI0035599F31|nr:hypothetical protein MONOS_943 [Monocercomonoides exilis]|eukprot:MONOS_943.1-p1 / transcript=MONOS_943.1 / gene=MONOS_943 / organism=Monocercomonoides_exilis_PA203 / gene_product=unspecified product / transcript_product=unspecified product / location=Mono_scaffold00015:233803-234675(+) / protein_length=232 / sequence_SO=supercontig / SO=protein_coding / is_pseudo=false